jgi:hypothetical protein
MGSVVKRVLGFVVLSVLLAACGGAGLRSTHRPTATSGSGPGTPTTAGPASGTTSSPVSDGLGALSLPAGQKVKAATVLSGAARDMLVRGADAQGNVEEIDTPGGPVYVTEPVAGETGTTRYVIGQCALVRAFLAAHPIGMPFCFTVQP